MVMDATQSQQPSPQSVGREFVRQYYTLLNKAPNHLHRFYNNNSSFIHGESTLVVGQREIHNRIQQLNFNDCHAKISQVDAQATLGQGVVVQVTGELSNDGQPMRRFTQTFVLAAQSPKKYYVHNDIFRYQDLYIEDEQDGESRSENDDEHDVQVQVGGNVDQGVQVVTDMSQPPPPQQLPVQAQVVVPQQQVAPSAVSEPQQIFYPLAAGAPAGRGPVPVLPAAPQAAAVPLPAQFANQQPIQNGVISHEELQQQVPPQALVPPSASPLMQQQPPSGARVLPSNVNIVPVQSTSFQQSPLVAPQLIQQQHQPPQLPPQQQQQQVIPQPQQQLIEPDEPVNAPINVQTTNEVHSNRQPQKPPTPVDDFKTIHEQQQQEKYEAAKQQQNEPKTYANLFKSTSSSPSGFVNAALQQQQQLHQQQQQQSLNNTYNNSSSASNNNSGGNGSGQVSYSTTASSYNNSTGNNNGNSRLDNGGPLPQRNNSIRNNNKGDFEQRRPSNAQQFGDNQQLFLGNIPHHASEDELREIFSRFGNVIELRILSKSGNKVPPGIRSPLNYGFITYDDSEAVQKCLANCPLYFPENSPDGQKLNVEEKKPRMRNDMAPRQTIGGGNLNNNMGRIGGNGPQSRPMGNNNGSGGGGMMRNTGGSGGGNMRTGGGGGNGAPRLGGGGGGGFGQRNDNRGGGNQSNGPLRGSGNGQSGGGNYGRR